MAHRWLENVEEVRGPSLEWWSLAEDTVRVVGERRREVDDLHPLTGDEEGTQCEVRHATLHVPNESGIATAGVIGSQEQAVSKARTFLLNP